ncbi:MAG: hypothetical protein ACLQU3_27980 [Limisphaerales bacterium]
MFFHIPQESQAFMKLVGKKLRGALTTDEQNRFDRLLEQHPEYKRQFADLADEVEESKVNELWERGLRVLLRCPQPEDRPFLESVKKSDPKLWRDFLQGAFVLRVMAESMNNPSKPKFSNKLTADEEKDLLAAVNAAQEKRKHGEQRPPGK